jgi:hypothetical protein
MTDAGGHDFYQNLSPPRPREVDVLDDKRPADGVGDVGAHAFENGGAYSHGIIPPGGGVFSIIT